MRQGLLKRFDNASYAPLHALQHELLTAVANRSSPEALLLGTHEHTITLGRGTEPNNLCMPNEFSNRLRKPAIFEIERGGDVTYHGPGQLVGYPIIDLKRQYNGKIDLHAYLRDLEEVLIQTLSSFDIKAGRKKDFTGVWVGHGQRKIASIGIAVRHWVTYHGFALNVSTDLRYFQLLKPCGLDASVMTSVGNEISREVQSDLLITPLLAALKQVLGIQFN